MNQYDQYRFILNTAVMGTLSSNKDYINFIGDLKQKIKNAQVKAMVTVNQQMLLLYREIGKSILQRQEESDWGDNVIGQVSKDLKMEFPGMTGFSKTSLKYMRTFALEYPEFEIGQPVVDQISWTHNVILMNRVKDIKERLRYAQKVLENGWSKRVLDHRIDSKLYEREGQAITNFSTTLPAPDSDFSTQMLKDPYVFDFLSLTQEAKEKEVEDALVNNIIKFLTELGEGFAFVGRQYPLKVGDDEFFIDLLFYHIKLRRYVVIELKTTKFKPEYMGKLNFYLAVLNDKLKSEHDEPSIGLILCKEKNGVVTEYAFDGVEKPIGIAEYILENLLEEFSSKLPSIEDLENELKDVEGEDE